MGISLSSWALKESRDVLNDLGARGVKTRILTMDPDNPALQQMINERQVRESVSAVKGSALRMGKFFGELTDTHKSFDTRLIRKGLPHQQLVITDETVLVVQYMYARGTPESPLLQLPKGTELHDAFVGEFEELWRLNQPSSVPS